MNITLQYFDGCPNWQIAAERLHRVVDRLGLDADVGHQLIESPEHAAELGFRGSPTVLVDGVDLFADPEAPVAFACRVYTSEDGQAEAPSESQLEHALSQAGGA